MMQIWEGSILKPFWRDGNSEADENGKLGPLKSLRETFFFFFFLVTEQVLWKHKRNTENVFAF